MAFTEKLKLEVKRAGHFCCCICHSSWVEIHHLVPQCEDGPDTFDNAAPLCPSCHEMYGGNPSKKKFITEARDLWYEICEKRYAPTGIALSEIKTLLASSLKEEFSDVKKILGVITKNETIADGKALDESEIVHHLVARYHKEYTPNIGFFNYFWIDEDLPEIRLKFQKRYGEFFFEIVCKYAMHVTKMDLNQFTEEELTETVNVLWISVILMCSLHDGDIEAHLRPDGEILWRKID